MEKKKKNLEGLKKYQLKNEGKKDVTGGIDDPAFAAPVSAPKTQECNGNSCTYTVHSDGSSTMDGGTISYDWY